MAVKTVASSSNMVTTRTRIRGFAASTRRVASMPPSPGIFMSMSTTSGSSSPLRLMASSPVVASPATSMSGCVERRPRIPSRKRGWSSAIRTRSFSIALLLLSSFGQRLPKR
jgi:hypothetical protein